MKNFIIEVINEKPKKRYGLLSYEGRITIGDFIEKFLMPLDSWSLEKYKQQWQEGLERIKRHNSSCLVSSVQNLKSNHPSIEMWSLYKEEKTIFIINNLLIDETMEDRLLKLSEFNHTTCYQFIDLQRQTITEDGHKISTWQISVDDFYASLEQIDAKI